MDEKPKRVGIYCRISYNKTGEQDGVSRQEKLCRELAAHRGWEVVDVYDDDDKSAWQFSVVRGEYNRLLADLEDGTLDGVIFYHMDRVAKRSLAYALLCDIYERKPHYVSASVHGYIDLSDPIGRGMGGFQVQMGGAESSATSRRLKDYYRDEAMRGKTYSNYPAFGWTKDGQLNGHAELVRQAVKDVLAGVRPTRIAQQWRDQGIVTERGNRWTGHALTRVLTAPRMAGIAVYHGHPLRDESGAYIRGTWEPMTDDATWLELVEALKPGPRIRPTKSLLGGIARCGKCGSRMVRLMRPTGRYSYMCQSKDSGGCASVTINGNRLDVLVTGLILGLLDGQAVEHEQGPFPGQARLAVIGDMIAELMEQYRGGLPGSVVFPNITKLEAERSQLQAEASKYQRKQRSVTTVSAEYPRLPLDKQRAIIKTFISAVVIAPSGRSGVFDPGRVSVIYAE